MVYQTALFAKRVPEFPPPLLWQIICINFAPPNQNVLPHQFFVSMEGIPVGFIFILLGVVAAGIVFTMLIYAWKQRTLQRLKDPHKDYYRRRG